MTTSISSHPNTAREHQNLVGNGVPGSMGTHPGLMHGGQNGSQ
jgi:hypothetical protein